MKKIVVLGGGGFIGGHLAKRLKEEGNHVRVCDIKKHEYFFQEEFCHEFILGDLTDPKVVEVVIEEGVDEVYQLAADMGGMGFIHSAECEIMHNSSLINNYMIDEAVQADARKYFFSSSVCVYRDMDFGEPEMTEEQAFPAQPDNEYGWEKLFAERMLLAYSRKYKIKARIARFQNCYGPEGTWKGGREKAPAAICRKVAEASDGGEIEVWGNGTAVRSYTYIDDMVDGISRLMDSEINEPTNIGNSEYVSVDELVKTVAEVAGKKIRIKHIDGPVGVKSRNFSNARIYTTGWRAKYPLAKGIKPTYRWIEEQVKKQ